MDDLEVRLEQLFDKHERQIDTERDVLRSMRDERDYYNKNNPQGAIGGKGFLEQLIGKVSGKSGILGAGMAGGAAASGIMILADIIGKAISNSKILMTVLGVIGQALGLLIDVILLPFLPILTVGIIWLFQGIMAFHKLWSTIWNSKTLQWIKTGLETVGSALAKGIGGLLSLGFEFLGAAGDIIWKVLKWIWELATSNGIAGLVLSIALGPVGLLLNWLWNIIKDNETVKFTINFLLGVAGDLLNWLWGAAINGLKINIDFINNVKDAITGGVSGAAAAAGGAISNPGGWLEGAMSGGWIPKGWPGSASGADGGSVQRTGLALIHKGETITPAGQGGGNTFHFYGYNDEKLKKSVEDILRRQNNRYNA